MASSPHSKEEFAPIADVNVVPLADVSLVLLIILLALSPMTAQSVLRVHAAAAKAPDLSQPPPPEPEKTPPPLAVLSVGLNPAGYTAAGRAFSSDAELADWLKGELDHRSTPDDRKVFLSCDLDIPAGKVVSTIEFLESLGSSSVALVQIADDSGDPTAAPPAQTTPSQGTMMLQ